MAKKSTIAKAIKVAKNAAISLDKREALKKRLLFLLSDKNEAMSRDASSGEIMKIMKLLDQTRARSFIRRRNRCAITGRPRSVLRRFGLSRNIIRLYAGFGRLAGVIKV